MIDRLRLVLNRPLRDADRPRLFALAVGVILVAAAALASVDDRAPAPTSARREPAAATPADERLTPPAVPSRTPTPPATSEEGRRGAASIASRAEVARAKRVARRFLRGYLRFAYGQGPAGAIAGATERLRRRLAATRPRVPAEERRRRPRVALVQSDGVTPRRARLVALVRNGRRYTVALELARTRAGWRVVSVGSRP